VNVGGQYRPDEGVDIEKTSDTGGGYNVGWISEGEWLEYTIRVRNPDTITCRSVWQASATAEYR